MRRVAVAVGVATLLSAAWAAGAPAARGAGATVSRCLRAWNARTNAANQHRLRADRGGVVSLGVGTFGTDSVAGTKRHSSESRGCVLTVTRGGTVVFVTGAWSGHRVTRWRFFPPLASRVVAAPGNVRITRTGRLVRG